MAPPTPTIVPWSGKIGQGHDSRRSRHHRRHGIGHRHRGVDHAHTHDARLGPSLGRQAMNDSTHVGQAEDLYDMAVL